jgi:hypothetical protein
MQAMHVPPIPAHRQQQQTIQVASGQFLDPPPLNLAVFQAVADQHGKPGLAGAFHDLASQLRQVEMRTVRQHQPQSPAPQRLGLEEAS